MAIKQELIKKWNEYFESLSPEEKRVAIAQDVLYQLKQGVYNVKSYGYIKLDLNNGIEFKNSEDVQSNFDKIKGCHVCALGACALSLTKFTNKTKFIDIRAEEMSLWRRLARYFKKQNLYMMEQIFENIVDVPTDATDALNYKPTILDISTLDESKDEYWYPEDRTERLQSIMKNIIRNNGDFVPTDCVKGRRWIKKRKHLLGK